jgi:hypothetical protein
MTLPAAHSGVLRRDAVRLASQPALIDCGAHRGAAASNTLAVLPVLDGNTVVGFEVRCGCGAMAFVECVYGKDDQP